MDIPITPAVDTGKLGTPQLPTEPTPEAKAMNFSTEGMNALLGKDASEPIITSGGKEIVEVKPEVKQEVQKEEPKIEVTSKVEEPKKEEVKKEEVKSTGVLKAPKEEKKPEVTPILKEELKKEGLKEVSKVITPVKDKPLDDVDLTKFSAEQQSHLKKMAREARDYTIKLIEENQKLSGLKDSTYLQHENAFILTPEFQQLQQKDSLNRAEARAWEDALMAIRAGKSFKEPTGIDKDGNIILSTERPAADRDEIRVQSNVAMCNAEIQGNKRTLQEFPQRFQNRVRTDLSTIDQVRKEQFAWVADPKLLDWSVEVNGHGEQSIKKIIADFKAVLPTYLHSHPLANVAADLMVALQIRNAELKDALNGKQVAEIKQEEIKRAEPTSDSAPTQQGALKVNGKEVPRTFSIENMPSGY